MVTFFCNLDVLNFVKLENDSSGASESEVKMPWRNSCSCHVYGTEFAMLLELNLPCNFHWICHTISTESAMPFLLNLPCYFYWIFHLIFYWICHVSCTEHAMLVVLNLHRVDFHVQSAHFSHTYCVLVQTMGNKLKRSRAATAQVTAPWSNYHASRYS